MPDTTKYGPPTLEEILDIDHRRRRTRARIVMGAAATVATVGVGSLTLNAVDREPDPTRTDAVAGPGNPAESTAPDSSVAFDDQHASSVPTTGSPLTTPPTTPTTLPCEPTWLADGIEGFASMEAQARESVEVALAWGVPREESEALAFHAVQYDRPLAEGADAQLFNAWHERGLDVAELTAIAEDWNVSAVSVKYLSYLGTPHVDEWLARCAN